MWFLDDQPLIALRQQLPHTAWKCNYQPPHRTGEITGDQLLARECYQAILASRETHNWIVEEEPPKPMEEAENIKLVEGDLSKTTKVGKKL